jgi:hypothetical protein
MNGKKAKRLRKEVFGEIDPAKRKYYRAIKTRQRLAEPLRRAYKERKRSST